MSNTPTLNETPKLLTKGGPHHPKLVEAIYDVYGLVDSLQKTTAELATEQAYAKRMASEWNDKAIAYRDKRDALQQQVKELQEGNRSAVESREIAVRKARETSVTSNQHYAMAFELREQLAERDRTISLLTGANETILEQSMRELAAAERNWREKGDENRRLRKTLKSAEILLADMPMDNKNIWVAYTKIKEALGE